MERSLVSVICLSYNHARFIQESVESVLNQTYAHVEIVLVDDASADESQQIILQLSQKYPQIKTLLLQENVGNCKAFNRALALATGEFIIDLAADDILCADRIEKQVSFFLQAGHSYGVVFTDAIYINERGDFIRNHFEYLFRKKLITKIPQGDIFSFVIKRYFIPSPTIMFRKQIIDQLGGYDENLAYEDFDFWVRSARITKYGFIKDSLTKIRKHNQSMSTRWYKADDKQLHSTYLICLKIKEMCRSEEELKSLIIRAKYELRQSVFSNNNQEAILFFSLLYDLKAVSTIDTILIKLSKWHLPLFWIRDVYHYVRFS